MASKVVSLAASRRRREAHTVLAVGSPRRRSPRWWTGFQFGAPAATEMGRGMGARC